MRDYMDTWVIPPKQVTSPTCTWGPPYPCKQALMHPLWGWSPNTSPQKRLLVWILASHISVNNRLLQMSHSKGSCCRNDTKFVLQLVTQIRLCGWGKAKNGVRQQKSVSEPSRAVLPFPLFTLEPNPAPWYTASFPSDFHNNTVNVSLFLFY